MLVYLIGFMGSGKSYSGKKLAEDLGWDFIDLDDAIVQLAQKSISQIFKEGGEERFRQFEKNALHALATNQNCIVATGGGCPCFFDNMAYMNSTGLTIYLHADPLLLSERLLPGKAHRPLIKNIADTDLPDFIACKLALRKQYYEQADHQIAQQSSTTLEDLVSKIKSIIKNS